MATLVPLAVLEGHTDRVWHASFHPTRNLLATASSDKSVRLWAPKAKVTGVRMQASGGDSSSAASAQAVSAASSSSDLLAITQVEEKWQCTGIIEDFTTRTVRCCEWSPDGKYLACTSFDGTATVWALARTTGEMESVAVLEGHENEVKYCAWSRSGQYLATCGRDKSIWLWEYSELEGELECSAVLHGHSQDVKTVLWHPSRDILVSSSYDDTIKVWACSDDDWHCTQTLTGHESTVWGLSFDAAGDRLFSVSDDCKMMVWRAQPASAEEKRNWQVVDLLTFTREATIGGIHSRTIFSVHAQQLLEGSGRKDSKEGSTAGGVRGGSLGGSRDRKSVV